MPSRYYQRNFIKGYFYHIYNRGANKSNVFLDREDYETFTQILAYYLTFPLGKPLSVLYRIQSKNKVPNLAKDTESPIILCAYCLMPNHFHLLIKQAKDESKKNSISNLMRRLVITYAMYFTKKYAHSGVLFQGKFKNVLIDSDIQLIRLSRYIHRNPLEIQNLKQLQKYQYSSYPFYTKALETPNWINSQEIINMYEQNYKKAGYQKFVENDKDFDLSESITIES